MKAMRFQPFGGLGQLAQVEIPPPRPTANQLLVEVVATSVNPIDWKLRQGALRWLSPLLLPAIPCFDFAGVARTAAGEFAAGDRVFGMLPLRACGAACEYVAAAPRYAARLPDGLRFDEAAGMPLAGMTALQALRDKGRLQAGQRLLVAGAAGGVGHYAVQIGKAMNAHVTGICSGRNAALARELGADEVLDYTQAGFALPAEPFDVIFDTVAGQPFSHWRGALAARGVYVSVLPSPGLALHRLGLAFSNGQKIAVVGVRPRRADLDCLAGLAQQGLLRTVIDQTYALDDLGAALEHSRQGRTRGKRVVLIQA